VGGGELPKNEDVRRQQATCESTLTVIAWGTETSSFSIYTGRLPYALEEPIQGRRSGKKTNVEARGTGVKGGNSGIRLQLRSFGKHPQALMEMRTIGKPTKGTTIW